MNYDACCMNEREKDERKKDFLKTFKERLIKNNKYL